MTEQPAPETLLAHRAPMQLIGKVLSHSAQSLLVEVEVAPHHLLCDANGAPGWLGLEWMAQAGGAWVGIHQRAQGRPIDVGFFTGTRHYLAPAYFAPGNLWVEMTLVVHDEEAGIAVFDGVIRLPEPASAPLAEGRIRLYQPLDVPAFIQRQREELM